MLQFFATYVVMLSLNDNLEYKYELSFHIHADSEPTILKLLQTLFPLLLQPYLLYTKNLRECQLRIASDTPSLFGLSLEMWLSTVCLSAVISLAYRSSVRTLIEKRINLGGASNPSRI